MEQQEKHHIRLYLLAIFVLATLIIYVFILYDLQVNQHEAFLTQSVRNITRNEPVEASRGVVTDRNGQVLISSHPTYQLTFDTNLLKKGEDANEAILRLLGLFRERNIEWIEEMPLSKNEPFVYTIDEMPALQKGRFWKYLCNLKATSETLGEYLMRHPKLLERTDENGNVTNPADEILANEDLSDREKRQQLLDKFVSRTLTSQLLLDVGITPDKLLELMRKDLKVPETFSATEARDVMGIRYELIVRNLVNTDAYVLLEDIDTELISLLKDGHYSGAKVTSSSVRTYETEYAAHILGVLGKLETKEELESLGEGYEMDDLVGRNGVEMAFEKYLKGKDGVRVVSMNNEGKITDEYWFTEPEPGNTVELTIDMNVQQVMEDTLARTIRNMNYDGITTRGAGAVLLDIKDAAVLAIASYPTFHLADYRQDYDELRDNPAKPLLNRATSGLYEPGSTYKPMTAITALEEGKVSRYEYIYDSGYWKYPNTTFGIHCWNRGGHGSLNVTGAINNSCNYFFCEMGYRLGIELLSKHAREFGLGQKTGIEVGEAAGILAGPEEREAAGGTWYGGDTVQSAFGQSDHQFTPIQIANYIATLVNGGNHYQTHLLKSVKTHDNSQVIAIGGGEPVNIIEMKDENLSAVKEGMRELTTIGSLSSYFKECKVTAGAKTGTAQLGENKKNNGIFVCFAPYEDPEVALAIVIERGGSGSALASTAVSILNAYFDTDPAESETETVPLLLHENQLIP